MFDFDYNCDDLEFTFYWGGRKDKRPATPWWHQPNIMDGGYCITSGFNPRTKILTVLFCQDSFCGEEAFDKITIPVEKCKEYHIYVKDKKLYCKEDFTRVDLEKQRASWNEAFSGLTPGGLMPLFPRANPVCIRDKIFTEFAKENHDEDAIHYIKYTNAQEGVE